MADLKEIIKSSRDLDIAIEALEERNSKGREEMRYLSKALAKSIHPLHLIAEGVDDVVTEPDLKNELINTVSEASGYLAKKLIVRNSDKSYLELLGSLAQIGISAYITQQLRK